MKITTTPDEYRRQYEIPYRASGQSPDTMIDDLITAIQTINTSTTSILDAEQAAYLLHCSVDSLRRIPLEELPTYKGVGRSVLYLKTDIEEFVSNRKNHSRRGTGRGCLKERLLPTPLSEDQNPADIALLDMAGGA